MSKYSDYQPCQGEQQKDGHSYMLLRYSNKSMPDPDESPNDFGKNH